MFLTLFSGVSASNPEIPEDRQLPRLVDEADVLTDREEEKILADLDRISEKRECDVVIAIVYLTDDIDIVDYADDFYDYNGYGTGSGDAGILLTIDMEYHEWAISTYGFGIRAFNDAAQEHIMDKVLPYLEDGDFAEAFEQFAKLCDNILKDARNGKFYGVSANNGKPISSFLTKKYTDKEIDDAFITLFFSSVIGLIVTAIRLSSMKNKLKTVHEATEAKNYTIGRRMNLTEHNEIFLYSQVSRRIIPTPSPSSYRYDNDNGSYRSSTHISSSGRSHGGSRGSFGGSSSSSKHTSSSGRSHGGSRGSF